jgi:hypothetical protein
MMSYYEKVTIQFTYAFERRNGEWKWLAIGAFDNFDEIAKSAPYQQIEDK